MERIFIETDFLLKGFLLERIFIGKDFYWKGFLLDRTFIGQDFYWKSTLIVGLLMELQRLRANPSRQRGLQLVAKIPLKDSKTRLRRGRYDHHRCNHR